MPVLANVRAGIKLLRSPGGLSLAVLALGVGVGLVTAVFAVIQTTVTPLPYTAPGTLMRISAGDRGMTAAEMRLLSGPGAPFAGIAAFGERTAQLRSEAVPRATTVHGAWVSPGTFSVLGVRPEWGRTLEADAAGAIPSVMVSERLVKSGLARTTPGERVAIDGVPYAIVGMMPQSFWFPDRDTDFWILREMTDSRPATTVSFLSLVGRLADGVSPDVAAERARASLGNAGASTRVVTVEPYSEHLTASLRSPLFLLQAAALLVLVLAGLNVSWLFVSRARRLTRVCATMQALGATRRDVALSSAVAALAVGALAAPLAVLVAWAVLRVAIPTDAGVFPGAVPELTWPAIALALGLASVVTIVAWLPSALASRGTLAVSTSLKGRRSRGRIERGVLAVQVALVFTIAAQAVMLVSTRRAVLAVNAGVPNGDVRIVPLQIHGAIEPRIEFGRYRELLRQLDERGVAAAMTNQIPLAGNGFLATLGARPTRSVQRGFTRVHLVTPAYFAITGLQASAGRVLRASDAGRRYALVNGVIAGPEPLQALGTGIGFSSPWTIVGVLPPTHHIDVYAPAEPEAYMLFEDAVDMFPVATAASWMGSPYLVLDSRRGRAELAREVASAMARVMPDVETGEMVTLRELVASRFRVSRAVSAASAMLAGVALFLAGAGVFGMVSEELARRRRDVGIRKALGATQGRILAGMLGPLALVLAAGIVLAAVCGGLSTTLVASVILPPRGTGYLPDAIVVSIVAAILCVTFVGACIVPTREAMRIDAARILRAPEDV